MLYACNGCEKYDSDFEGASASRILTGMFERRLVFVVGKGGAGKTTLSAAIGLAAARMGKKVLIAEVGDSNSIGQLFGKETLPPAPEPLGSGLWGVRLNARDELDEYIHYHVNVSYVAKKITRSSLFDNLLDATPGLKEVMILGQIWRLVRGFNEKGENGFDFIVIDAPATGHGLSLLKVPQTLVDMITVGPIAKQINYVKELLSDEKKTWLTLTTLAEELPVNEAVDFMEAVQADLGMHVVATFVNSVYQETFSREDQAKIEEMAQSLDHEKNEELSALLKTAQKQIQRRQLQESHISTLRENTCGVIMELPFYYTNAISMNEIEDIAELIKGQCQP